MNEAEKSAFADQIINKARSLGASLAGIASVEQLKNSPSHDIYTKIEPNQGVGSRDLAEGVKPGEIAWPPGAGSAMVIALAHKESDPQLDWWIEYADDRESRGGQILQDILNDVSEWAAKKFRLTSYRLPYHIEKGGIFVKDAGVLAGFGSIGKNNLLITPQYGPRVRVWARLFDEVLPSTGPVIYDPCNNCKAPCRQACPRNAFGSAAHSPIEMGMDTLPGKDGWYDREVCRPETEKNIENKEFITLDGYEKPMGAIKFCRLCELSCPVGKEK
jgi:epoxyqueuosine reductase